MRPYKGLHFAEQAPRASLDLSQVFSKIENRVWEAHHAACLAALVAGCSLALCTLEYFFMYFSCGENLRHSDVSRETIGACQVKATFQLRHDSLQHTVVSLTVLIFDSGGMVSK